MGSFSNAGIIPVDMKKTRIVIIDDHKLVRQMWALMFAVSEGVEIAGECGTLQEAIDMVKVQRPDIVLLDINLGLESGMEAMPLIRKYSPGTRIIAVSMHAQTAYAKKMLQLGAKAYITKNSSREELVNAVEQVMEGKIYICEEIQHSLANEIVDSGCGSPNIKDLSLREMEIIGLMKEGYSSKEISAKLHIGVRTVDVHRYNMLKKLKMKNTAALVNFINNTDLNFI